MKKLSFLIAWATTTQLITLINSEPPLQILSANFALMLITGLRSVATMEPSVYQINDVPPQKKWRGRKAKKQSHIEITRLLSTFFCRIVIGF